jgi:hypothetical protein
MEHKKIAFVIFGFFCDFIRFSKLQLKHTKGVRFISRTDPWKVLGVHSYALGLHKTPQKEVGPCHYKKLFNL